MYGSQINILRSEKNSTNGASRPRQVIPDCQKPGFAYLPNAAIGWKQPNGFFYPPAFHSRNLFFGNVDLRHYVIDPLFKDGTYRHRRQRRQAAVLHGHGRYFQRLDRDRPADRAH